MHQLLSRMPIFPPGTAGSRQILCTGMRHVYAAYCQKTLITGVGTGPIAAT